VNETSLDLQSTLIENDNVNSYIPYLKLNNDLIQFALFSQKCSTNSWFLVVCIIKKKELEDDLDTRHSRNAKRERISLQQLLPTELALLGLVFRSLNKEVVEWD
jgi:hypothetical protein